MSLRSPKRKRMASVADKGEIGICLEPRRDEDEQYVRVPMNPKTESEREDV